MTKRLILRRKCKQPGAFKKALRALLEIQRPCSQRFRFAGRYWPSAAAFDSGATFAVGAAARGFGETPSSTLE